MSRIRNRILKADPIIVIVCDSMWKVKWRIQNHIECKLKKIAKRWRRKKERNEDAAWHSMCGYSIIAVWSCDTKYSTANHYISLRFLPLFNFVISGLFTWANAKAKNDGTKIIDCVRVWYACRVQFKFYQYSTFLSRILIVYPIL